MLSKAMVLTEFGQPLTEEEIRIPPLTPGQVLVKLTASGVCGSDLHMLRGEDPRTPLPIILGHEGIGLVMETAGKVKSVQGDTLQAGDVILWNRGVSCDRCFYCQVLKDPSLCQNRRIYGINVPAGEAPLLNGCYSEYIILVPGTAIFKIEEEVEPEVLVSASCSGATMAHAFDLAAPKVGDTVVVQGPGPLGVYAVAFARQHGASQIIVIGGSANRLELCAAFGANVLLNRKESSVNERLERVLELTGGRGADLVVEAVGYPEAMAEGLDLVRRGGTYSCTGFAQPVGRVEVEPYEQIVKRNIRIQGVWVSDTSHLYRAMQLVISNPELFARLVTHRYPLHQANEALTAMAGKEALKAVLLP